MDDYAARTRMCPRFALARRLTRISTSLPSAARNSSNLSTEYSSKYPRISFETRGWSIPMSTAASV